MTHGSLFSGIGGFDLAAEWMGWENKFHCEWNPFGQKVLKYYWPNSESFDDITKTDFSKYYGTIDLISGGFPCQPYSTAGDRKGKEDERHLWPEMCRAIREVAPRYVVGENVRGLTNWNGGMVFDEVCSDLENLGYQVSPYIIPACATDAPHKRERIWFIAHSKSRWRGEQQQENRGGQDRRLDNNGKVCNASNPERIRLEYCEESGNIQGRSSETFKERADITESAKANGCYGHASNTGNQGLQGDKLLESLERKEREHNESHSAASQFYKMPNWEQFPTQSPICGGDDGLPSKLDGIAFSKWRNESIKGYGNAVCPQVVLRIFKAIEQYELLYNT
jgi:DNA (cytosine-5)-methyltransferase 1